MRNNFKGKNFLISYRLCCKIIEGRNFIDLPAALDAQTSTRTIYCVLKLDDEKETEVSTQQTLIENPFWSEELFLDIPHGFLNGHFTVYIVDTNKKVVGTPFALGKAVIPKKLFKDTEEWYVLRDSSYDKVFGTVQLLIKHYPPRPPRTSHGFQVIVLSCKGLSNRSAMSNLNPFVVLHLFPDPNAYSTQKTQPRYSNDPIYNEKFYFTCSNPAIDAEESNPYLKSLNVAVWSQEDGETESKSCVFLGNVTIPLSNVILYQTTTRSYQLTSICDDSDLNDSRRKEVNSGLKSNLKDEKLSPVELEFNQHTSKEPIKKYREFAKIIQQNEYSDLCHRSHILSEKTFAGSNCHQCLSMMVGTQYACSECKFVVHKNCLLNVDPLCGSKGSLRLKMELTKTVVFEVNQYLPLLRLLVEDNFNLLVSFGRFSNSREEIARKFLKILNPKDRLEFVKRVVEQETLRSEDSKTLFRANSLGTKALDVFMKLIGTEYLKHNLEGMIKLVVSSPIPFEIDPLRIETPQTKDSKEGVEKIKQEIIQNNAKTLKELNTILTENILESAPSLPIELRKVFKCIKETVEKRFPDEPGVKFTAISGFIILRFFAPAILGPNLFGLKIGILDKQATRKVTLIAKTLQNLGNLVEFGQKEAYMEPMNSFLCSHFENMKKFLNEISTDDETEKIDTELLQIREDYFKHDDKAAATNFSDLINILRGGVDKLSTIQDVNLKLVSKLEEILEGFDSKRKEIEDELTDNDHIWDDVGIDIDSKAI